MRGTQSSVSWRLFRRSVADVHFMGELARKVEPKRDAC